MPVYNEESYIAEALDSLLTQDFEDFEIIISDNASEDNTGRICIEYASRDPRIRYCRNETNIGSVKNFNRVFMLSSGEYFSWASGHDLRDQKFITRCLEVMTRKPSVLICMPQTTIINVNGKKSRLIQRDTQGLDPVSRFECAINGYNNYFIHGLIRASALKRTRLFRPVIDADLILLAELSLLGEFALIPENLFYARKFRGETGVQRIRRVYKDINPRENRERNMLSLFHQFAVELLSAVIRGPIDCASKVACMIKIIKLITYRYGTLLSSRGITSTRACNEDGFCMSTSARASSFSSADILQSTFHDGCHC